MAQDVTNRSGTLLAAQLDYILLDGSGSMMSKWHETLAGLDGYMGALRAANIASHGIVSVFEGQRLDHIQRDSIIAEWGLFTRDGLQSGWGGTPLYDAVNLMGRSLRDLDPPRASIVIITDGMENGSRHTSAVQAKAILDWCRAKGWQVTFLGADFNNSQQAKLLGANPSNSIGVQKMLMHEAGKLLGEKRVRNILSGDDISFTDEEKKDFGGYLAGPAHD